MTTMFNCTQNIPSTAQKIAGVYSVDTLVIDEEMENRKDLLSFHWVPSKIEMEFRAEKLTQMVKATGATKALLGE